MPPASSRQDIRQVLSTKALKMEEIMSQRSWCRSLKLNVAPGTQETQAWDVPADIRTTTSNLGFPKADYGPGINLRGTVPASQV